MLRSRQGYKNHSTLARKGALAAVIAGVFSTGVLADTLAQPQTSALEKRAAEYVRYRQDVVAIETAPLENASATRDAHKRLAAHDPEALSSGWVAYAALVAADTPEFAAALRKAIGGSSQSKRARFFTKLSKDPSYPRKLKGAKEATERVLAMTTKDASRFYALGESFKSEAYAMQKTSWGKKRIAASSKRISEASKFAANRGDASAPSLKVSTNKGVTAPMLASMKEDTWAFDWGAESEPGRMTEQNAQVIMDRVLNLAARYAVGSMNEKLVEVYAQNNKSKQCLSMAKLTLTQCIAATRSPYEEAFCLGEHGLNDIGGCLGWVASVNANAS